MISAYFPGYLVLKEYSRLFNPYKEAFIIYCFNLCTSIPELI